MPQKIEYRFACAQEGSLKEAAIVGTRWMLLAGNAAHTQAPWLPAVSNPHFSSPMRNAREEAVVQMGFSICAPGVVFCVLLKRGGKTLDATPCVQSDFLIDLPNR